MDFESVRASYEVRAADYVEAVGSIDDAHPADRERILGWARAVRGRILDVGSGPGQWTDLLRRDGVDIEGIEPVESFLAHARRRYPDSTFRPGRAEHLSAADRSLGGILAWFSLIHTDPESIGLALSEFARTIAPGGSLLLGFFTGTRLEPFDHAVTTAHYWPVDDLAAEIERAGFSLSETHVRFDPTVVPVPGRRPEATIIAIRTG